MSTDIRNLSKWLNEEQEAPIDRQALARVLAMAEQPAPVQQEPVAFYRCNGCGHAYEQVHPTSCDCMEGSSFEQVNYYTSPPAQRKPLTDEQIKAIHNELCGTVGSDYETISRAIEAAHGIKDQP